MITGNGQTEAYTPAADNEGRDAEIRRHLKSSPGIGIQIKVTFFTTDEGRSPGPYLTVRHRMAWRGVRKGKVSFSFAASLAPASHDRWSPFRVAPKDLGKRLLEIVDKTGLTASSVMPHLPQDAVLVGRAKPPSREKLASSVELLTRCPCRSQIRSDPERGTGAG
jgi:hypothetical protein